MANKSLQKPKIVDVHAGVIKIAHPDISRYTRTYVRSPIAAAGTSLTVADNHGFADNDYFVIGVVGTSKAEEGDVNGVVTRGQSLTITNSNKFAHEIDEPVTRIFERKITVYGAATDGGALTAIRDTASAINIEWNKLETEFNLLVADTAYAYYVVKFYDGTTESAASDYIPSTGLPESSAEKMIQSAMSLTSLDRLDGEKFTRAIMVKWVQDCQEEITSFTFKDPYSEERVQKDWSFEVMETEAGNSLTISTNVNEYSLTGLTYAVKHPYSDRAVISLRYADQKPLTSITAREMQEELCNSFKTAVKTQPLVGDTELEIDSNIELPTAGTIYVGVDTITYTGKSGTDTLTGIPASGAGSITVAHPVDTPVWYGNAPGKPTKWISLRQKLIFNIPFSSDYEDYNIYMTYFRVIPQITEASDSTIIPFYHVFKYYLAHKIELARQDFERASYYRNLFEEKLLEHALADQSPLIDYQDYYTFI